MSVLLKCYETTYNICSNSAEIWAGPEPSTFHLACSRPELWSILCAMVWQSATHAGSLSNFNRKWSSFEAKMPPLALEGVERLLLEVGLVSITLQVKLDVKNFSSNPHGPRSGPEDFVQVSYRQYTGNSTRRETAYVRRLESITCRSS